MPRMTTEHEYLRAGNTDASCDDLRALIRVESARVRRRVAENSRCPEELLKILASDRDQEVRIAVATNPVTPHWLVERLAADESIHVRFEMAEDPNLPGEIIEQLAQDENPYVSDRARRTLEGNALEDALVEAGFRREEGHCERLGELLVHAGFLKAEQVDEFLRISCERDLPLGRIIVQMRVLARPVIVSALSLQSLIRRGELGVEEAVARLRLIR